MIARVLGTRAAGRLSPQQWAGAEEQLAAKAELYTPTELQNWGTALVELLDQDGEEPDDRPPAQVNELFLTRLPGGGGKLRGRFDDAAMFDAIATVIDAKAKPLTGGDDRSAGSGRPRRWPRCAATSSITATCPECGGHRPHLNILIRLDDLENRARAACLDFGGPVTPESLRMLCCDAAVVPIVLNGTGQPLDVGRVTRTIPDGLRRAVAARDLGCAHPGCGRPVVLVVIVTTFCLGSWAEIRSSTTWSCSARHTTGRSIPRNGSCGSATDFLSSFRRNGWTSNNDREDERCHIWLQHRDCGRATVPHAAVDPHGGVVDG